MENTLENKAKFFSQYLFTGVIFKYQNTTWGNKIVDVEKVISTHSIDILLSHSNIPESYSNKVRNGHLELKSLLDITDEDAILIFNKVYPNSLPVSDFEKIETIKGVFESDFRPHKFLSLEESTSFVDQARKLGYALPFNGVSVEQQIEYGWIKLIKI